MRLSLPSIRWWWSIWSRWSGSFSFLLFASSRFRSRSSSSSAVIFSFLFLFSWVAFWRSQVHFGVGGVHIILKYAVAESWIKIFCRYVVPTTHLRTIYCYAKRANFVENGTFLEYAYLLTKSGIPNKMPNSHKMDEIFIR